MPALVAMQSDFQRNRRALQRAFARKGRATAAGGFAAVLTLGLAAVFAGSLGQVLLTGEALLVSMFWPGDPSAGAAMLVFAGTGFLWLLVVLGAAFLMSVMRPPKRATRGDGGLSGSA